MANDVAILCMGCMRPLPGEGETCAHCSFVEETYPDAPHRLSPHTVLGGRYLVGKCLGEGGFGITYLGQDRNLEMKIAIKEYYPGGHVARDDKTNNVTPFAGESQTFFERGRDKFLQEARSLAKFDNLPGIVSVKDFFLENGTAYIVMEFVEGTTLASLLEREGGRLPENRVLDMMRPVLQSLSRIHGEGLVHRDISPDNLMVSGEDAVKLLDFGSAWEMSRAGASMAVMLKPGYTPEEQYRTQGRLGPWTDVYALCATIFRAIEGHPPPEAMERLRQDTFTGFTIPVRPNTAEAVYRGLELLQEDRWQSVDELYQALYGGSGRQETAIIKASMSSTPRQSKATTYEERSSMVPAQPVKKGKRGRGWVFGAVAAVVCIGTALVVLGPFGPTHSEAPPSGAAVLPEKQVTEDGAVIWQDPAFELAVRGALSRPQGDILSSELADIAYLDIQGSSASVQMEEVWPDAVDIVETFGGTRSLETLMFLDYLPDESGDKGGSIVSLDDIVHFSGLRVLRVQGQPLSDISPLAALDQLEQLNLQDNDIEDIGAVGSLNRLSVLRLDGNRIGDLSPLADLDGLEVLTLDNNAVRSIAPLEGHVHLLWLSCAHNEIGEVKALAGLQRLMVLKMDDNRLDSIAPLGEGDALRILYLDDNHIADISALSSHPLLMELTLQGNQITELDPISGCTDLLFLDVSHNLLYDVSPLSDMEELEFLYVREGNLIVDFGPVAHVPYVQ